MKRKPLTVEIVKIIVNCIALPLYFIDLFKEVAILPGYDKNGEQVLGRFNYYLSIYDEFDRVNLAFLIFIAVALSIASIAVSALQITVSDNKKIKLASHILFGISAAFFSVLLFVACLICYS